MKIQLHTQKLRVRIDEDELQRLLSGDLIENVTLLGPATSWRFALRLATQDYPQLECRSMDWALQLPQEAVHVFSSRLPCRDGLEFMLPGGNGHALAVIFDVDVRDSARVRGRRGAAPA
ncbi:MAG TPA: hypothetical protein VFN13_01495 [Rudaea sp.]|nr:hypothetical protein [Rudaea sp.]